MSSVSLQVTYDDGVSGQVLIVPKELYDSDEIFRKFVTKVEVFEK